MDNQDERQKLNREPKLAAEAPEEEPEHHGGGRFNRRLLVMASVGAMVVGIVLVEGVIHSTTMKTTPATQQPVDVSNDAARDQAEVEDLAAGATHASVAASPAVAAPVMTSQNRQTAIVHAARVPSRYAEWAADKYMRALEAPQMVAAFHAGGTLEIGGARTGQGGAASFASASANDDANVTLHPPASPYTVMTGSIIPAVLVSGINSDLPGPILAQVSQNVFDSATGRSLLIPQGSRLVGLYRNASGYGQQRVQIAFQRLIFPDTSSMDLPQMPGGDRGRLRWRHRPGEQPLSGDLRHRSHDQPDQCGPGGWPDGGFRRRRQLWSLRLLPAQSVGDGGRDRRLGGVVADGCVGPADDGTGNEPAGHHRSQAGLRIQRDAERGPGVPGTIWSARRNGLVRESLTRLSTKNWRRWR